MISLLRYGSGFPWNRLADFQESLGIPLPVATQCEIVAEAAAMLQPATEELIRQTAQGEVLHNDDTSMPCWPCAADSAWRRERKQCCGAQGRVHQWDCLDRRETNHRIILHRTPACRREPGRCPPAACRRTGSAHAEVRRALAQPAQAAGEVGSHRGPLPGACPATFCGDDRQLSAAMPVRAGTTGQDLRQRCHRP